MVCIDHDGHERVVRDTPKDAFRDPVPDRLYALPHGFGINYRYHTVEIVNGQEQKIEFPDGEGRRYFSHPLGYLVDDGTSLVLNGTMRICESLSGQNDVDWQVHSHGILTRELNQATNQWSPLRFENDSIANE